MFDHMDGIMHTSANNKTQWNGGLFVDMKFA